MLYSHVQKYFQCCNRRRTCNLTVFLNYFIMGYISESCQALSLYCVEACSDGSTWPVKLATSSGCKWLKKDERHRLNAMHTSPPIPDGRTKIRWGKCSLGNFIEGIVNLIVVPISDLIKSMNWIFLDYPSHCKCFFFTLKHKFCPGLIS